MRRWLAMEPNPRHGGSSTLPAKAGRLSRLGSIGSWRESNVTLGKGAHAPRRSRGLRERGRWVRGVGGERGRRR